MAINYLKKGKPLSQRNEDDSKSAPSSKTYSKILSKKGTMPLESSLRNLITIPLIRLSSRHLI